MASGKKILFKRGTFANIPTLDSGEPGWCTDTYELYMGTGVVNRKVLVATSTGIVNLSAGLKFPATPVASADVNTLDDYEEGAWTPTFTNITVGDGTVSGTYVIVGNHVYLEGHLIFGSTTAVGGSVSAMAGFPVAVAASYYSVMNFSYLDQGTTFYFGTSLITPGASGTAALLCEAGQVVDATHPHTWAVDDIIVFSCKYKR